MPIKNPSAQTAPVKPPARVTFGIPSIAAVVLGTIAGVLEVLNETTFGLGADWHAYLSVILVFLAGVGISPLVGPQFRAALHLPPWAGIVIGAGLAALALGVTTLHMSEAAHGIIVGVIALASALGFAPAAVVVTPAR